MAKIRFGDKTYQLPTSRLARTLIAIVLIVGGILGFLPVLGFWMIPLGLLILSIDFAPVRRKRRQWTVALGGWLKQRYPALAAKLGFGNGNGAAGKSQAARGRGS